MVLYNIPGRTAVNMGPDLLAELAQIDGIAGVKQANSAELQLIDGLAVLAGNDDIYGACLDMGGAGGICVASHLVGPEMRRMYDEPERRAEIDASLRDVYDDAVRHREPDARQGGAQPPRSRRRDAAPAAGRGRRGRDGRDPRDAGAPRPARRRPQPPPTRERHVARPPAGRRRRDRQEHDRRRVRGPDRAHRRGTAVPDGRADGDRPRAAGFHLPARPRRRHRGDRRSPTATRTTSARCRGCCASWGRRASRSPTAAS